LANTGRCFGKLRLAAHRAGARGGGQEAPGLRGRACPPMVQGGTFPFTTKPETRNPKLETRNPKPETRNAKPEARSPHTEAQIPKPETRNQVGSISEAKLKLPLLRREAGFLPLLHVNFDPALVCLLREVPSSHPTPYTLQPSPYTLHPSPYILHPTPYTLHLTPYTLHPTPDHPPFIRLSSQPKPEALNPEP